MRSVTVKTSATYEVLIGSGLLQKAGEAVKKVISPCKAAIVTDSTVVHLYEENVRQSLTEAGFSVCTFVFPAGEASKNIHTLSHLLEFLAKERTFDYGIYGNDFIRNVSGQELEQFKTLKKFAKAAGFGVKTAKIGRAHV